GGDSPLFSTHQNEYIALPKRVQMTHDIVEALDHGDVTIISIVSQAVGNLMERIKTTYGEGFEDKRYCICMKGLNRETGARLSQTLREAGVHRVNIAVFVGPGHVQSISRGEPTNMIISSYSSQYAEYLQERFESEQIAITTSSDILGVEIGSAAKNVYGIVAGILEASGLGTQKGPLMVAAIHEMADLIDALGGKRETASGLSLVGDFEATLFNNNSNNLTYGKTIIRDGTPTPTNMKTAEGVAATKALLKLRDKYNAHASDRQKIKLLIVHTLNEILDGKISLDRSGIMLSKAIGKVVMESTNRYISY
ncbi:MAG: hypothetical protein IKC49_01520, partial [Clostridia bacterium]|nr:hypothetical protein [Clostridia bacterium]